MTTDYSTATSRNVKLLGDRLKRDEDKQVAYRAAHDLEQCQRDIAALQAKLERCAKECSVKVEFWRGEWRCYRERTATEIETAIRAHLEDTK